MTTIVLARMGSSRFPGKHLGRLGDTTLIGGIIERAAEYGDAILATSSGEENDPLCVEAASAGAKGVYRGSEDNVWLRIIETSLSFGLERWISWLGDCPFVDERILESIDREMSAETDGEYFVSQAPLNPIEGVMVQGWTWKAWVRLGEGLVAYPEFRECPWQVSVPRVTKTCPVNWRDFRSSPVKASIDYPFELAIANRIVAHLGKWPTRYEDLISAYKDLKEW